MNHTYLLAADPDTAAAICALEGFRLQRVHSFAWLLSSLLSADEIVAIVRRRANFSVARFALIELAGDYAFA